MISKLSQKYQEIISLCFLSVFFIYGLASAEAQVLMNSHRILPLFNKRAETKPSVFYENGNLNNLIEEAKPAWKIKSDKTKADINNEDIVDGGPGQPEMATFKSVDASNMVSKFTGDFSYNIPLFDVGGYPVNMFYNSGITMDQDASWVGLGWNINPGTINRNMRGIPDDFDGSDIIIKQQNIRPDKTYGVSGGAGFKFAGFPIGKAQLDLNIGISWNNKLGVSANFGLNPALSLSKVNGDDKTSSLKAGVGLSLDSRNGGGITPSISFSREKKTGETGNVASLGAGYTYSSRMGVTGIHINASLKKTATMTYQDANDKDKKVELSGNIAGISSNISFLYPTVTPSVKAILTRKNYSASFSLGTELYGGNGHGTLAGYYSESYISEENQVTEHKAYGFLNYDKGNSDNTAMLDFNRLNDGIYTPSSPAISIPLYTYDIFSITGEGTGGSFRAYRNDVGYVRDANIRSVDDGGSIGLDLGFGNVIHGGAELSGVISPTETAPWKTGNMAEPNLQFKGNSGDLTAAYFKNPGEKTVPDEAFQNAIGGESLVRFKLLNYANVSAALTSTLIKFDQGLNRAGEVDVSRVNEIKKERDKRTQVISFLSAEEATRAGFIKKIFSFNPDTSKIFLSSECNSSEIELINRSNNPNIGDDLSTVDDYRMPHHISQIEVVEADGKRYIYGLPVYNIHQTDVSFSVKNTDGNLQTGKSNYSPGNDDSPSNRNGRDWFVQKETMPAYAHSFLITELVSPNYVDVTGDGISEDDMGDAVKFNYSRFKEGFNWRTPVGYGKAAYSEGLKTDDKDDRAHYVYGELEKWLLYSIESKNMLARFFVKNDRKDCRQVVNQNGSLDNSSGMLRLYKICLYSKGDLAKTNNADEVRPIKTIHFFQSYKLCMGSESSINGFGKLTLDSIWITYNGNLKKARQRYVFNYPSDNNPAYNYLGNDRWGNYKPSDDNPGNLSNNDFPYSSQDAAKANKYASAWTMNSIVLPSGGKISLEYESDDYAYVQDRRAANFNKIIGFGKTPLPDLNSTELNQLYRNPTIQELQAGASVDNDYVYVVLPDPVTASSPAGKLRSLRSKYFANVSQLYLKLSVVMPSGPNVPGLEGSEIIPVYADIDSYGLVSPDVAWIKVKRLVNGLTPMSQEAFQFIKQQLPGKAFKTYDMSEQSGIGGVVMALGGMIGSLGELINGVEKTFRNADKCRFINTSQSFVRLSNPYLKKYGGGLRVKKVIIQDNWNKMTGQYESTYGQEYKYTTTEVINNELLTISSGVASWEPSIGGDENPHKEMMRFLDHNKGGPYDFGAVELPICEALYPSPFVGYRKVEILSIHRENIKNAPTRQVTEFYTTKEFPFKSSATLLAEPDANIKYKPSAIASILKVDLRNDIYLSQGFLVDINDMNGKIKREATYSYTDPLNPFSYTEYFYNNVKANDSTYKFNHVFPAIESADGKIKNKLMGRDIEVMIDFRQHSNETFTANLSPNFDFFFLGIFPVPITNILQPVIYEGNFYRSASILKIVNHYGILDSIVVVDRGSMVSTKNMVYDAETGYPLLTRTNNEHNRPVYNFTYPAHWAYSGMGPAYRNIDAEFPGLNFSHGKLKNMPEDFLKILESGDEIYVVAKNPFSTIDFVQPCDANAGTDPWSTLIKSEENKIWAVNTSKVSSLTPQWIFLDQNGNPYNAKNATAKIIRSGHRNMLDKPVGSITCLNSPVNPTTGELEFSDESDIIQTSGATFKDHWRVDQQFYAVDSTVIQSRYVKVHEEVFYAKKSYSFAITKGSNSSVQHVTHFYDRDYITARQYNNAQNGGSEFDLKSWLLFDLDSTLYQKSNLKKESIIMSAKLSLYSHYDNHLDIFPPRLGYFHATINSHDIDHIDHRINDFKINRMVGSWLPNNDQGWLAHFRGYEINSITNQLNPEPPLISSLDYSYKFSEDNRIEATKFFRAMAEDKFNINKNYSTAIKIRIPYFSKYKHPCSASVCFNFKKKVRNSNQNNALLEDIRPNFRVKYFNCSEAYPYGYVPEAWEDVAKCNDTTFRVVYCLSKFPDKKAINPYVEGILGNWRPDTSFVFYGERKEDNTSAEVDTRTGGAIKGFKYFWKFINQNEKYLSRNYEAHNVWVWNNVSTQFNRKGYEIENKDPLGRFNSGLYGYNQHLPVAVANNARLNEIMFDGFEDYDYKTSKDCINCKPRKYFNFEENVLPFLDSTESHTGRMSLKIESGQSIAFTAPLKNESDLNDGYALRIKVDSTYTQTGNTGLGLKAEFFNNLICQGTPVHTIENAPVNFSAGYLNSIPGMAYGNRSIRWTGKIKMPFTGNFAFRATSYNNLKIYLNNALVLSTDWSIIGTPSSATGSSYSAQEGQLVDIIIEYQHWDGVSSNVIEYGKKILSVFSTYGLLLNKFLFSPSNVYVTTDALCAKADSVNVRGNALTDTFALIKGKKMLISAWVKEGGSDCKCESYVNNNIRISFPGTELPELVMLPEGNIIEGWQRYEGVFTVPAEADDINFSFVNSSSGSPVYFDDIRIQPFSSNMKSFVYHSSNLRLMSELDENNYATFYEYDEDGTLARVKKETEKGIKTLSETRSAIIQE